MERVTGGRVLAALFAAAVANAVLLLALLGEPTGWRGPRDAGYVAVACGFAAAFGVLTLLRGRAPRATLVVAVLTVCGYYIAGLPSIGVVLPLLVFLAAATTAGHRWFALIAALALFAVAAFFRIREGSTVESILGYELLSNLVLAVLAIALAEVMKTRRELQRTQSERTRLAADAARAEAERAQLAERARIARELHDELGHSLAIVSLHANASAERLPADHPAAAGLDQVRGAAARALRQLRDTVRAIGGAGDARPRPEFGLGDLDPVVSRIRSGGIAVDLVRDDVTASPEVEAAAFRIVQEAITNAVRHARPRHVRIAITAGDRSGPDPPVLRIDVRNDGAPDPGRDPRPAGGLAGLRKRAAELGGEVEWGFAAPDRFTVRARLPAGEPGR